MTPSAIRTELIAVGETEPYREKIAQGLGNIEWATAYNNAPPDAVSKGENAARSAITADADQLAAVDYVSLALPAWVTVTRKLSVTPGDFNGQGVRADQVGVVDGEPRWLLFEWQGPEIPQREDRPIVYRWVTVHALYDIDSERVTRLAATIRGEVHE
jgi:hypothetical protein